MEYFVESRAAEGDINDYLNNQKRCDWRLVSLQYCEEMKRWLITWERPK